MMRVDFKENFIALKEAEDRLEEKSIKAEDFFNELEYEM